MKINYNGKEVGKWYHNDAVIPKAYINDNMVFPRMPDSAPPTPEYDVMCSGSISDYTGNAPEVFCFSVNKWYMRTIGGNYTEYGIYATGKPQDPYIGELAIDSGHEWEYTSNGWVDLGATSRLPQGYTELEYIEAKQASSYINNSYLVVDFKVNQDTRILCSMQRVTSSYYARLFGSGAYNAVNAMQIDYEQGATGSLHVSWGAVAGWTTYNVNGDYNKHEYDINKNVISIDSVEIGSTTYANFQCTDNLGIFVAKQPNMDATNFEYYWGKMFYFKVFDNGTLALDLVPAKRDNDSVAGAYDVVNKVFYTSETAVNFTAGPVAESSGGGIIKEYEFKGEPDIPDMDYKVMVTGTISDYTGSESKVYCFSTDKWYMRTVEGNYKEYGIYAVQLSNDAYVGELAIYNGHEWEYTSNGWSDLGEVESGGSLPVNVFSLNYNAKHMDGNTFLREEGQLVDADATINGSNYTINDGYVTIGNTNAGTTYCAVGGFQTYMNRSNSNPEITIISKAKTNPEYNNHYSLLCNRGSSYNWMWRPYRNKLCLHGGSGEIGNLSIPQGEVVIGSARVNSNRQLILNDWSNGTTNTTNSFSYGSLENSGFAMFRDYYNTTSEPWSGDFYWVFMCQSTLTDEEVQQVIQYNEEGGIEYIKEYTALADPEPIGTTYTTAADEYLKVNDNYYKKDYITYEYQCGAYLPSTDYVQGDQLTPIYVQGEASDFIVYDGGRYYKNYIYVQPVDQQLATGDYVRGDYIGLADVIATFVTTNNNAFNCKLDGVDNAVVFTANNEATLYGDLSHTYDISNFVKNNSAIKEATVLMPVNKLGSAFYGCGNLEKITMQNLSSADFDNYTFYSCGKLKTMNINYDGCRKFGAQVFAGVDLPNSFTIGSGVTSINDNGFASFSCDEFIVDSNNSRFTTVDGALIAVNDYNRVYRASRRSTRYYSNLNYISYSYNGLKGLTELHVDSGVTSMQTVNTPFCDLYFENSTPMVTSNFNVGSWFGHFYVPSGTQSAYRSATNFSSPSISAKICEVGETPTVTMKMQPIGNFTNEGWYITVNNNQYIGAMLSNGDVELYGNISGAFTNSNKTWGIMDFTNSNVDNSWLTKNSGWHSYKANNSVTTIDFNYPYTITMQGVLYLSVSTPPNMSGTKFMGCVVVPDGSKSTYQNATNWSNFADRIFEESDKPTVTGIAKCDYTKTYRNVISTSNSSSNDKHIWFTDRIGNTDEFTFVSYDSIPSLYNNTVNKASIVSIDLSNTSITYIGDYGLNYSTLTSVKLPDTLTSLGYQALVSAPLEELTIPSSVTSIGRYMFTGSYPITMQSTVPPTVDYYTFWYYSGTVYVPDESVNAYKTATNWDKSWFNIKPISEKPVS